MLEPIDDELIKRARRGERAALEQLVRRSEQSVYRLSYRVVGNESRAEEVRQTVLLRLVECPEKLPEPTCFDAWIRQCAVNTAISLLRRERVRETTQLSNHHPSDSAVPVGEAVKNEDVQRLGVAMEKLQPEERAILSLRFDEALTFREIGKILDQPTSTIKSQYARSLSKLFSLLKDSGTSSAEVNHHV